MKLSEGFPTFTYRAYKDFNCFNLISENHPRKVKNKQERQEKKRINFHQIKEEILIRQNEDSVHEKSWIGSFFKSKW